MRADASNGDPSIPHPEPAGELRVVATPIGNLGDLSPRGADALRTADLVLCEDTRHSRPLLRHFEAHAPVEALHEHNEASMVPRVVSRLQEGAVVALISDAGTPLVSDPGARLVEAAIAAGIRVTPIPGPSALLAAVVGAGLGGGPFTFFGFLERKGKERQRQLAYVSAHPYQSVVYESPQRLGATLADLVAAGCGGRRAAVARELTKHFEEFRRGTVSELAEYYREATVRGEVVLVVEGAATVAEVVDPDAVRERIREWRAAGASAREVASKLVEECGKTRNEAYRLSLEEP
ncbi:MAG: 16S rRNA (cytidine(1402)-2'-O)-methyltransferase [Gemmatimonadetes bacterium]|nr:16S rRNA (cytidine(1402)-2'-O)-methyltransferase [Gemmatimonadota bacterium]